MSADVLAAQSGDLAAFSRLVDRWSGAVSAVCLGILKNVQASEEAAQDTFIAAWQSLAKLNEPTSFGPWVRALARNKALTQRRSTTRRESYVVASDEAVQQAGSAHDPLLAAEEERVLAEAIDALPDDARDVMVLYYREGQSVRQVAELLGLSEAAVKKRMSRAREQVRAEVLERMGTLVRATAPGAAFTASVLASLAPAPAAAATVAGMAGGSAKVATAGLGLGALFGGGGILLGYSMAARHVRDDQRVGLVRARNTSLLGLVGAVLSGLVFGQIGMLVGMLGFVALLGVVQFVMLPRVLALTVVEQADPRAVAAARIGTLLGAAGWLIGAACGLGAAWWGMTH